MKLAHVESPQGARIGMIVEDGVVDLTTQLGITPSDLPSFLAIGADGHALAERCARKSPRVPAESVRFRSPTVGTDKLLGVGMNYRSFVAAVRRSGAALPSQRVWFARPRACIADPYGDVWLPRYATDMDYEGELAIVIGRRCRHVVATEAKTVIGGYTIANDLTLRDRISRSLILGKSFDTHTPLGPWVVTPDEIEDPHDLAIRTWVNRQLRQDSSTADMIASCYELIEEISAVRTLNPGDVIMTGTPDGTGLLQQPPSSLLTGDVIRVEVERIGAIENHVVNEPKLEHSPLSP
jgi:2-keto-4-pentenoate hydratase/2-oxohepta-3-ene-1,7-dioic acid hydratase in catechol pathway